jgi:hypothetical protein
MVAPASAVQFDVTGGSMSVTIGPAGAGNPATVSSPIAGTFDVSFGGATHIGDSTMVSVDDIDIANTNQMATVLIGVATATLKIGSVRFTDFDTTAAGHLMGGVANPAGSGYLEVTVFVTGEMYTTYSTGAWGAAPLTTVTVIPPSSAMASDIITVTVATGYVWEIGITSLEATLTMDFVVTMEGTAHVPEPALGSLVALGLGGAGAWLRRRRS